MEIFVETIERELPDLAAQGVRVRFIGRRDRATDALRAKMSEIEADDGRQRAAPALDRVRLRRPRGHRRGGAPARGGGRRRARRGRERDRVAALRSRDARARPPHPHVGRAADLELPPLAARLHGARLLRHALARLRRARPARRRSPSTRAGAAASAAGETTPASRAWRSSPRACRSSSAPRYVGGWFLTIVALVAGLVALHELYSLARELRPLVLAGYGGAVGRDPRRRAGRTPSGCSAASCSSSRSRSSSRPSRRRASRRRSRSATTVLGAAWVGLGLAHLVLLRGSARRDGRRSSPCSSPCSRPTRSRTSAGGSRAGTACRRSCRPGKTWEGFVVGALAGIGVVVPRPLRDRVDRLATRSSSAPWSSLAADDRRPLRVAREARPRREGHGPDPARPRRRPRPGRLAPLRRARRASTCSSRSRRAERDRPRPYTETVKRVALLGATGSIGRQALEIDRGAPGARALRRRVRLARRSSGLAPLDAGGRRPAPSCWSRREPDVVLNAVVGFAGLPATLWTLEHGIDLALANKESLVAAGELALAARERGGGRILPVDSEHSAAFQCLEGRAPETVRLARPHGLGRPVPRPRRDRARA